MSRIALALGLTLLASGACAQGCGPNNPNCIVPTAPVGTNDNRAASTAFVMNALSGIGVIGGGVVTAQLLELLNAAPLTPISVAGVTNGLYGSGSGAVFNTTTGPGDTPRVALYLKGTAVTDASIPEYMAVFDCNLNSGRTGVGTGISDNKVCFYDAAVTGPNSGTASWASATNMVIGAGDTGTFKITGEFDITNNAADCAVGTGRNCYAIYVSGDVVNPVTAMVALALPVGTAMPAAHFGILINGRQIARDVDIENSGGGMVGFCNSCLLLPMAGDPTTHSVAGIIDNSITPVGIGLHGTYPKTDPSNATGMGGGLCFEASNAACIGWNGDVLFSRFPFASSFLQAQAQSTVASLNTTAPCNTAHVGFRSNVINGVAGPALGSPVGPASGSTWQPVVCNGTVWVYG